MVGKSLLPSKKSTCVSNLKCELGRFEVHAVDHCNLACMGCNHASPFLKKREYQAEEYFPWIDMLREGGANFHTIGISGGEPFVHKNINNFVKTLKQRYNCYINLFTNCFWLKGESSLDDYADALSRADILMLSAYKPIVERLGNFERLVELGTRIRERFGIKVGMFQQGVYDKFFQCDFYEEPVFIDASIDCHVKDCHQLTADGLLYRCTLGHALKGHPGVTEGFRNSKDLVYDLKTDPEHRLLLSWKDKWPLDACAYCGNTCDRAYPTTWESDPKLRSMDREEYLEKLANAERIVLIPGQEINPPGGFL